MKYSFVLTLAALVVLAGCTSSRSAWNSENGNEAQDTLHVVPLTIQDVVDLSKQGVSDSIIISQMEATHSRFALKPGDIISLTKEGVSAGVINVMIHTANEPPGEPPGVTYWYGDWYPFSPYGYWGPYGWYGPYGYYWYRGGPVYHGGYPRGGGRYFGRHR